MRQMRCVRRLVVGVLVVGAAGVSLGHPVVTAAQRPAPGAAACEGVSTIALPETTLVTTYTEATPAKGSLPALPAHCVVRGAMSPRVGVGGRTYETRFELRLPTEWSGRFFYQGGGGNDGSVQPAIGRNTGSFNGPALTRGYAVVTTDAGHQGGGPEFGLDPQAKIDHAYASHDRTARVAKDLVARYYGRPASHSYFIGCSGGGRQGMMFAQRFPDYFDGIVACAPAMSVSSGATIAAAWDTAQFLAAAPVDETGQRILSRAFSNADLDLVSRGIVAACDLADGAVDGMVQDVTRCRFDPASLRCDAAKTDTCLLPAQVTALTRAFDGPVDSSGRRLYVGQPWDPGIRAPGWRQWKLGTSITATPNAANTTLMAGALAYQFFTPPDPTFALASFDFDRDPARMEAYSQVYDTFRDATLDGFRARGGRLLLFHGTADGIFSASESAAYYERLAWNTGGMAATQSWARLFLIPGMNHCAGGPATDSYDGLAAIEAWVERGVGPDAVPAAATSTNAWFPNRTRPLCPCPSVARYSGSGSLEEASSFRCAP
jgi:pimeloyl-ACP methyl ester carboxylesterase